MERRAEEIRTGARLEIHGWLTTPARPGEPLEIADPAGVVYAWLPEDDRAHAYLRGDVIQLRGVVIRPSPRPHVEVREIRRLERGDPLRESVLGPLPDGAAACDGAVLGFDIETVGAHGVDSLPERERARFQRMARDAAARERRSEAPTQADLDRHLERLLALHPLTTRVVSVALQILDGDGLGWVTAPPTTPPPPGFQVVDEATLLRSFWQIARRAHTVVGYNSRGFDVPVLMARSALLGIPAGVDLQRDWSGHVDLLEVLSGPSPPPGRRLSLELVAHAFGIPAKQSAHGSEVHRMVLEQRYGELAAYNLEDARATVRLYSRLLGTWL